MGISSTISRVTEYYARHGFKAMVRRVQVSLNRSFFASRMVVFCCDLNNRSVPQRKPSNLLKIEHVTGKAGLNLQDLHDITSFWNPKLALRNMKERFEKGASLWLARSGDRVAGYGWTLQGSTIEPYYFPLSASDIHLFDFHVFEEYRGRGINPILVTEILHYMTTKGASRAFIEAAEWNAAQLSSLQKTAFRPLGLARSFVVFGRRFTYWDEGEVAEQVQKAIKGRTSARVMARPHEQ